MIVQTAEALVINELPFSFLFRHLDRASLGISQFCHLYEGWSNCLGAGTGFYFVFSGLLTPSTLCNYCGKLAFSPRAADACATGRISQAQPTDDATQSYSDMVPSSFHLLFCSEGKRYWGCFFACCWGWFGIFCAALRWNFKWCYCRVYFSV